MKHLHTELDTISGKRFDYTNFDFNLIDIEDISHALSNQCRYGGHCSRFYSVAEHSIYCMRLAQQENMSLVIQKWALLHDASEAYCVDVPRGLKNLLPEYNKIEDMVQQAVAKKFNLPWPMPQEVKIIDNSLLKWEHGILDMPNKDWYFGEDLIEFKQKKLDFFNIGKRDIVYAYTELECNS